MTTNQDSNVYTLTAAELPAVQALLAFQRAAGPGAPVFTSDQIFAMMAGLEAMSTTDPDLTNTVVRAWTDPLWHALSTLDTSLGVPFPGLYIAYRFATFPFPATSQPVPFDYLITFKSGRWTTTGTGFQEKRHLNLAGGSFQTSFQKTVNGEHVACNVNVQYGPMTGLNHAFLGFKAPFSSVPPIYYYFYDYQVVDGTVDGVGQTFGKNSHRQAADLKPFSWRTQPKSPGVWATAVETMLTTWRAAQPNPPAVIPDSPSPGDTRSIVAKQVLNPDRWTDVETIKTTTAPVATAQVAAVKHLMQAETLSADAYIFLLHTLIALGTGDATAQALAAQIVTADASSAEYPNDIVANQLLYATLLGLNNVKGAYRWDHDQLVAFVEGLQAVTTNSDPASTTIATALATQRALLHGDSAYPAQDPNAPAQGFDTRLTDTLAALDKARAGLRAS